MPIPIQHARRWTLPSLLRSVALITTGQLLLVIIVLRGLGRVWWCQSGDAAIWISSPASAHTSQHLFDPYSFSHVCHGLIFGLFLAVVWPRGSLAIRFSLSMAMESVWEIFENTPFVINRYRDATAALGYEGDSVLNSAADIFSCGIGFVIAARLRWQYTIGLLGLIELVMLAMIRDSLLLNIIMLCYPLDSVRQWQLSAAL